MDVFVLRKTENRQEPPPALASGEVHQPAVDEVLEDDDLTELTSILYTIYYDCLLSVFTGLGSKTSILL